MVEDALLSTHPSTSYLVASLATGNSSSYLCSIERDRSTNSEAREILSTLSARHGSRFPLVFVVRTPNQGLAERLGAPPNRPLWSRAVVQAPNEGRSREAAMR